MRNAVVRRANNPPNPWRSAHVEYLEEPPEAPLVVYEEEARSILSRNESPDVPFRYHVNPYRGCLHGCAYCYARPYHEYLDFGAGTDFERRIVVKTNAPAVLERELARKSWRRWPIGFCGVTDGYQALEAGYGVTRACLEVCLARRNPVGVITKGALVRRDADLLAELARAAGAVVWISIPFLDAGQARAVEPFAPSPERRFEALAALAAAGVPCGVGVAPVIAGLNDDQIPGILDRARACGASRAFCVALRLPRPVDRIFFDRLAERLPLRARRVRSALDEVRGGVLDERRFGVRMTGHGPRWRAIEAMFRVRARRLGLEVTREPEPPPPGPRQGKLFA